MLLDVSFASRLGGPGNNIPAACLSSGSPTKLCEAFGIVRTFQALTKQNKERFRPRKTIKSMISIGPCYLNTSSEESKGHLKKDLPYLLHEDGKSTRR